MPTFDDMLFEAGIDLTKFQKDKQTLVKEVLGMDDEFKKGGDGIVNAFNRAISEQKSAIKDIEVELRKVYSEADKIAPGQVQAKILGGAVKIEGDLGLAKQQLDDMVKLRDEFKITDDTVTRLSTKYNEAKNRLTELNLANKQGTEEYSKAEAEVEKYGTAINETNKRAKALSAGGLANIAKGIGVVSGSMAVAQSLMGLFGEENEDLNEIMLKTQALLSVSVTLNQLQTAEMGRGGIVAGIVAVQEGLRARAVAMGTTTTIRATIAQKAMNLAANANPYILLATAILTVVGAIALYASATSEAAKNAELAIDINKKMADSVAEPLTAYKTLQAQWNALGVDLKAKEKFVKDNEDAFNKLGVEVKNVSDAENFLVKQSQKFIDSMILKAQASAYAQKAMENYKKAIDLQSEYDRVYVDKNLTVYEQVIDATTFDYQRKAQQKQAKEEIEKANKEADHQIEVQLAKMEQAKSKLNAGDIKEYKPYKETKSNPTKSTSSRTKTTVADEYLPPGSVAEIQKRLSAIDQALSKSNNIKNTELLKAKRISLALDLVAAEKKIRIRSFDEEMAETKKEIELRDKLIQSGYSKDQVDQMLPQVKDKTYIGFLEETEKSLKSLIAAGDNTDQTANNIIKIREAINDFQGNKTFLDDVSDSIDRLKSKFSGSELINQLEKYKNATVDDSTTEDQANSKRIAAEKAIEEESKIIKSNYEQFLKEHKSFEEQKNAITEQYNELRKSNEDSNLSPEQKLKVKIDIDTAEASDQLEVFFTYLQNDGNYSKIFTDMNSVATIELQKFRDILVEQLNKAKSDADKIKIGEFIEKIDKTLKDRNPMKAIKAMFKAIGDEALSTEQKLSKLQDGIGAIQGYLKDAAGIVNDTRAAFDDLGISTDNAFGDILDDVGQTIEGLSQMGEGVAKFAEGFATSNPVAMVAGAVKAIGGAIKAVSGWFNDDKKKEREIKKQAAVLKELESVYNNLGRAIDKALGEKVFDASKASIENLKQQKVVLEQMIRLEKDKKEADQDKINGYKDQINSINNAIEDMKQSMIDRALNGINAKGLADQLADALTSAFQNGEDAATAMGKTVDKILADMVKNALKMKLLEGPMQSVVDKMLASMGFSNIDNTSQIKAVQDQITALEKEKNKYIGVTGMGIRMKLQQKIDALKSQMNGLINGQSVNGSFDGLTEAERQELKDMIASASQNYTNALGEYEALFSGVAENAMGLKGDIKGITEKTAGALEAQINAIRIYQVEGLSVQKACQLVFIQSLQNLVLIEFNTRRLHSIDSTLAEMNGKMKKGLAGIP